MQMKSIRGMESLIKHLLFLTKVNRPLAQLVNCPIILGFHQIKKPTHNLFERRVGITDPDFFEKIITYISSLGYRFITLDNLVDRLPASTLGRVAAVTFDDGFKDLYLNAYPILKKFRIPFALFLTTSTVGSERLLWLHKLYMSIEKLSHGNKEKLIKEFISSNEREFSPHHLAEKIILISNKNRLQEIISRIAYQAKMSKEDEKALARRLYLNKAELRKMDKHGLSIEAHGHEHWLLSKLNQGDTEKEIGMSVRFIEDELGRKPRFFCLPFGENNEFVENIVRSLGLIGICAVDAKAVGFSVNPFRLSRIVQPNNQDMLNFSFSLTRMYLSELKSQK